MLQNKPESSSRTNPNRATRLSGTGLNSTTAETSSIVTIDLTIGSDDMNISETNGTERRDSVQPDSTVLYTDCSIDLTEDETPSRMSQRSNVSPTAGQVTRELAQEGGGSGLQQTAVSGRRSTPLPLNPSPTHFRRSVAGCRLPRLGGG
ncbi:hypothetical protein ZHAS_00018216 [Anopheles sinensis]|uniref:Uncharacterized protein n=1 Tax=Anopheles sinensis TaxID=74873 RepID=A0A084WIW0_ANOSI|nr:hypothetical protein ZHAS_00018216 [Anopheles sinensis]